MRISDWSSDVCSSDLLALQAQTEAGIIDLLVCDYQGGELRGYVRFDRERLAALATLPTLASLFGKGRSEERRVGKECVSTCRSRWSQYQHNKTKGNYRPYIHQRVIISPK